MFSLFVPYDALQCPVEGTFILLPKNKFTSVLSSSWFEGKISTSRKYKCRSCNFPFLFLCSKTIKEGKRKSKQTVQKRR